MEALRAGDVDALRGTTDGFPKLLLFDSLQRILRLVHGKLLLHGGSK
jgi:hypothetical protein